MKGQQVHWTINRSSERLEEFDIHTGWRLEQVLFNNRGIVMTVCLIITLVLGFGATRLKLNASFEKTIPTKFPYIANYLRHKADLSGFGNAVRITVEAKNGTIYNKDYLETLRQINDDVFLMPGVDRAYMKSLWTPSTQWRGVTEEGFESGPVIPDTYDGSPAMIEQIRSNVERSGEVGQIVAQNSLSSVIFIPLLSTDVATGKPLDYGDLSNQLEAIRTKYSSAQVAIHITGFAKVLGDLIDGLHSFLIFFAMAILISGSFLLYYIRCWRATSVVVICSLVAVVWQLGLLGVDGLCARPVFDSRALPDLRHRHEPRLAEDERHFAGCGPRNDQNCGCALHLPPALPGRIDRPAGRCRGIRGAVYHPDSGDPGTGAYGQYWRGHPDRHQPDPGSYFAQLRGREPQSCRTQPPHRTG